MVSLKELQNTDLHSLFFDYNSLIHPCAQQILSANNNEYIMIEDEIMRTETIEKDIIRNCINYTNLIISSIAAKNTYFVIDGVAPRSKMNQQRERRYKSYYFKFENSEKSNLWDSNKITPGTNFMNELSKSLKEYIKSLENDFPERSFVLSDSLEAGEGEHKIMKILNSHDGELIGKFLVYALDADLIFLSLINKRVDDIILVRDNSFNDNLTDDDKTLTFLNIKQLKTYIYEDIIDKFRKENLLYTSNNNQFIADYVVLCFFLGNDFLDHLFCLSIKENGLDILCKAYIKAWKGKNLVCSPFTNITDSINLVMLKDIFYHLKHYEEYYLSRNKTRPSKIDHNLIDAVNNDSASQVYFYNYNFKNTKNVKAKVYSYHGVTDVNSVCMHYLEGLYWISGYYGNNGLNHIHNNWSWYYKYDTIPFCDDLYNFMKNHSDDLTHYIETTQNLAISKPSTPLKQLCLVLPRESLMNIMKDNMNYRSEFKLLVGCGFFHDKICVDISNKDFLWQSKVFFKRDNENILNYLFD